MQIDLGELATLLEAIAAVVEAVRERDSYPASYNVVAETALMPWRDVALTVRHSGLTYHLQVSVHGPVSSV